MRKFVQQCAKPCAILVLLLPFLGTYLWRFYQREAERTFWEGVALEYGVN